MLICKYHRDDSTKNSDNEYFLQFIFTVIICLIPINAVYSVTLSSNVLFNYSLLFLCFLIKVMIDKNGQIGAKFIIIISFTLAIMSGLNNYGIIIALISLITIAYYLFKKGVCENTFLTFVSLTIVCILLIGSLNLAYDVRTDDSIIQNDAFGEGMSIESARDQFFSTRNDNPIEEFENITSPNLGNSKYNLIDSFVSLFKENFILNALFNNPILYMIFSIILLSLIYVSSQYEEIYLLYAPAFLNIIIVFLTGQNNLYSNLLVFYLIVVILINIFFKIDFKIDNFKNITPKITKQEKIETNPNVKEETYFEDNFYSNLESEIENLTLDEINKILGKTPSEENLEIKESTPQGDSDLVDNVLKEIEKK